MPRKVRENVDGGIYHAFARGNDRSPIFRSDVDRLRYLSFLGTAAEKCSWHVLSYCLMQNHIHLLVETPDGNLSQGMHRIQGPYTQWFNARYDRCGHLFQGRYGANRIVDDAEFEAVVRYIADNPVAAGLCCEPEEWPWSSFNASGLLPAWLDLARLSELRGTSKVMSA